MLVKFVTNFKLFYLLIIYGVTHAEIVKFCDPYQPNIEIKDLPELSEEFQSNIQLTLPGKMKTTGVTTLYDRFDFRAELIADENVNGGEELDRQVYYYDLNELLRIDSKQGTCEVKKINETNPREVFFGLVEYEQAGYKIKNMLPPEDILHFRQPNFTFFKAEPTTIRGIPVDHFKSCQNWDLLQASYHIDYFFTKPGYKTAVTFDDKPVPILAVIEGSLSNGRKIRNEYNYFKYRTSVQKRTDIFSQPPGYYCERQTDKKKLPDMPDSFTFVEESIVSGTSMGKSAKIAYSYSSNVASFELIMQNKNGFGSSNLKIIHDYSSGISYQFNKDQNTCELAPIDASLMDSFAISSGPGTAYRLLNPQEIFHLDDSYFYAGQRYDRGRLCDVFVSKRFDYSIPGYDNPTNSYYLFEWYFLNIQNSDQGLDVDEPVIPVTLKITLKSESRQNITQVVHFYDFDSKILTADGFDITRCYTDRQKKMFGIKFMYPKSENPDDEGMTVAKFNYYFALKVREQFYSTLINSLSLYNYSPFRLIAPKLRAYEDHFVLFTGITDRPDDIKHFTKTQQVRCDASKAKEKYASSSAAHCATLCLDSSAVYTEKYKCLSFDFCVDSQMCAFYNFSRISDPSVILDNASFCDHYSKTVDSVDAVSKETVYRLIEDLVIRGEFDVNIMKEKNPTELLANFAGVDIFPAWYGAEPDRFQTGQTSFYDQFLITKFDTDFDQDKMASNKDLLVRSRDQVSIDECARLCLGEPAFICESMTYSNVRQQCRWSTLTGDLATDESDYLMSNNKTQTFDWFTKDTLYNYEKFEGKTTSVQSEKYIEVSSVYECAKICNKDTNTCRSFNLCQVQSKSKCLISSNHLDSISNDPSITYSPICDHYSRKTLFDFKLVPQTQMITKEKARYFNSTAERCAKYCEDTEAFVCRSFDFFSDTNECYLYVDNLMDGITGSDNPECSHYSRLYFTQNGVQIDVEGKTLSAEHKYGGGTIFIVTVILGALGFAVGVGATFLFRKFTAKKANLPTMEFINPNYAK